MGENKKETKRSDAADRLLLVTPHTQHWLKLQRLERIKDYLLTEELINNREQMKPLEKNKKNDQRIIPMDPMSVGTLEEIIDDNYEIVSTSLGSEHHISILSFVDNDLLE